MIDTHLHFKTIFREGALWNIHHTSIVDEKINWFVFGSDVTSEFLNRGFIAKIQVEVFHIITARFFNHLLYGLFRFGLVASSHNDSTAIFSQIQHSLLADAGIATCNDCYFAG
jgi:hypothetical protein